LLRRVLLLSIILCAGCATRPLAPAPDAASAGSGARVAAHALEEIGRRYRFGGDSRGGFDCSGLASYVHAREGFVIPRTAAAQFAAGSPVAREALRAGDLLFFRIGGAAVDHVAVYVGNGEFVHAPGAGNRVRLVRIDSPWFAQRYAGAARWWRERVAQ